MIVCVTRKWLHIFYDWRLVKTISSFWASFTLLYFNYYNCFPAVPNKNCCFQTECWAVIQSQGFTAIHNLLAMLFKMPAESHDWFTIFTQWGTRGCCIYHSDTSLHFPHYFSPHFLLFKSIPPYEFSYRNISGKNGTTELIYTPPARYLSDFSVLTCIYLLPLLKTTLFFRHFQLQPYKLPVNGAKFYY